MPEQTCASCGGQLVADEENAGLHAVCGREPCWPDGAPVEAGQSVRVAMGTPATAGMVGTVTSVFDSAADGHRVIAVDFGPMDGPLPMTGAYRVAELQRWNGGER